MIQVATTAVHQSCYQRFARWPGACQGAAQRTCAVVQVDRLVAVVFDKTLHIAGNDVVGFIPADTLKFTFATLADAFHRVFQTIGIIDATTHGATSQTGAYLMQTVVVVITGVVGFNILYFTIYHVHTQRTAATTVHRTRAPDDFLTGLCWIKGFCSICNTGKWQGKRATGHRQSAYRRRFHQTSATNLSCQHGIGDLSFHSGSLCCSQ